MLNQVLIQVFFLSLFLVLTGQAYAAGEIVKRYAILVAANDGGSGRVPLRFTQSDAVSVRNVLQELGGLESSNSLLLQDPSPEEIEKAFVKIETKIRSDKTPAKRSELFFYYSGHSDETGLLLGQQRLAYARLKKALVGVNSDVQIAILDSCASGAFTRIKGGSHKPPFMVDESSRVKGYAILTSSSANENAQESDAVGGGYFTHYLVSALRGAGDTTLDKKVSLDEAYQYAFHETLAKTQDSLVGAQHAAYDFKLVGAGNLVLTELSQSSAALSIEKQLVGRLYVRDPSGRLVVELNKTTADATMDVSLAPDSYSVTLDQQGTLMGAQQRVLKGQRNVLRLSQFEVLAKNEDGVSRGSAEQAPLDPENDERYEVIPLKISLVPGVDYPEPVSPEKKEFVKLNLQLIGSDTDAAKSSVGVVGAMTKEDVYGGQGAVVFAVTGRDLNGGQGAGLVSLVKNDVTGGQGAGFAAITQGNLLGGQGAGLLSMVSGDVKGVSGAGFAAITKGNVKGVQGAGFVNIIRQDLSGVQGSMFFNYTSGRVDGYQLGIFNMADEVSDLQMGLVNISKKNEGLALGLLNVIGNGRLDVGVAYDESGYENLVVKSGIGQFYNNFSVGGRTEDSEISFARLRWGMGWSLPFAESWQLDTEALIGTRLVENDIIEQCHHCAHLSPEFSLGVGINYQLIPEIRLFATASVNTKRNNPRDIAPKDRPFGKETGEYWPGLSVGAALVM